MERNDSQCAQIFVNSNGVLCWVTNHRLCIPGVGLSLEDRLLSDAELLVRDTAAVAIFGQVDPAIRQVGGDDEFLLKVTLHEDVEGSDTAMATGDGYGRDGHSGLVRDSEDALPVRLDP